MSFKLMKVFDCQDMPNDIKKIFFELYTDRGNDVYIKHALGDDNSYEEYKRVDGWLIENKATLDENVLINYWW